MRRKKSQTMVKVTKLEEKLKGFTEGSRKKNSQVPTFDTSIFHWDLIVFNYYHIIKSLEWSETKTIGDII